MEKYIVLRESESLEELERIKATPESLGNIHRFLLDHYETIIKSQVEIIRTVKILENGHLQLIGESEGETDITELTVFVEEAVNLNTLTADQKKSLTSVSHTEWGEGE